jgi:hypothetical protein
MQLVCSAGVTDSMPCGLGDAFLKWQTIKSAGLSAARLKDSTVLLTRVLRNYQAWVRFISTIENNVYERTNLPVTSQLASNITNLPVTPQTCQKRHNLPVTPQLASNVTTCQ